MTKYNQEQTNSLYWRYKKKSMPTDEFADKNGEVKILKPANKKTPKKAKQKKTKKPTKLFVYDEGLNEYSYGAILKRLRDIQ